MVNHVGFNASLPAPKSLRKHIGHIRVSIRRANHDPLFECDDIDPLASTLLGFQAIKHRWKGQDIGIDMQPMWSSVPAECRVLFTSEAAHEARQSFLSRLNKEGFSFEDRWRSGEIQSASHHSTLKSFMERGFALTAEKRCFAGRWFTIVILSPERSGIDWRCYYYVSGQYRLSISKSPSSALFNAVDDVGHSIRQAWPEWSRDPMQNPVYLELRTPRELGSVFQEEWAKKWKAIAEKHAGDYRRGSHGD